jgi:hypothetical protein
VLGSLAGAVTFQIVTKVCKRQIQRFFFLMSAIAKICLTVRNTIQAGIYVGYSDLMFFYGESITFRKKGTPGITG